MAGQGELSESRGRTSRYRLETEAEKDSKLDADRVIESVQEISTVEELLTKTAKLSAAEFSEAYPHPFLICIAVVPILKFKGDLLWKTHVDALPPNNMIENFINCPCLPVVPSQNTEEQRGRGASILVGRVERSDIVLNYPTVSKRHAQLDELDSDWYLTDLGSRNGTYVEGARLKAQQRIRLTVGETIDFSKNFSFFFVDSGVLQHYFRDFKEQGVMKL